jgi:predicted RND superfamily exporter protein
MHSALSLFNRFFERAPQVLLPWRWSVVAVFLVMTLFLTHGMLTRAQVEMSLESWFQEDDPIKRSLDEFRSRFGSDDGVYVVYRAADGDVFSEASINAIRDFHLALDAIRLGLQPLDPETGAESLPLQRIQRIDSLYNARYQVAEGDTLISRKLLAQEFPQTDVERERKRLLAVSQESMELALYSKDFAYGGIRLKTDFGVVPVESDGAPETADLLAADEFELVAPGSVNPGLEAPAVDYQDMQMEDYMAFMADMRLLASRPEFSQLEFHYTGNAPMMDFFMGVMAFAGILLMLMVLVVMAMMWFLFRSTSAVIWPLLVVLCSAFWSFGLVSLLDLKLSLMVSFSFMLILAVGIADCVHVLSGYLYFRREGFDHRGAMVKAYRKTGMPIFLTTITTMAGMGALTVSEMPHIRVFGFSSALGVLVAFLLTIFVLPVLLDIWHPFNAKAARKVASGDRSTRLQRLLDRIPALAGRHGKTIVIVYFAGFGLLVFGGTQVKVDSNLAELTAETSSIRITYDLVDANMMGGQNMEFMLSFGQRDALKDPEVLRVIDAFQNHIEATHSRFIKKTFSLADLVKDTHRVLQGGVQSFHVIPDDPHLTAQLLYLFDNANPDDRREMVSDDYARSHITVTLRNAGSHDYTGFFDQVRADMDRMFAPLTSRYPDMNVSVTGSLALMMELVNHISWTQIKSFSLALVIITGMLVVAFGSLQAGLIAIIPNLLPAVFAFGVMGLLGIPLDTDTLIIAPLIIGIAVDDTIHFIAHYRDAWFDCGDVDQALISTIKEVGQAVTFTSLILGLGFSMLAYSDYMGHAKMGIFGSLAIFVALSSDLLLLPALIKWLKPDLGRRKHFAAREVALRCES